MHSKFPENSTDKEKFAIRGIVWSFDRTAREIACIASRAMRFVLVIESENWM